MTEYVENAPAAAFPLPEVVTEQRRQQSLNWDSIARGMRDFSQAPTTLYYRECEIALIRRAVGDLRGKRLLKLDLWNEAINTRILNWASSEGAEAYGLDLSRIVAARARRNAVAEGAMLRLTQADIRDVPFRSGSFDVVYTMGTIEHIDEYAEAVREVRRVLRPGGIAIIGVPNKWDIFLRPLLVNFLEAFGKYPYAPEKSFSAAELKSVVEEAGLQVIRRTGILTIPGILRMADLFFHTRGIPLTGLTGAATQPFRFAETRWNWPGYFGYLLTVVAVKR
jgi:SAM-dependent methyltransferase